MALRFREFVCIGLSLAFPALASGLEPCSKCSDCDPSSAISADGDMPPDIDYSTAGDFGASSGPMSDAPNMIGDALGAACTEIRLDGSVIGGVTHPKFACSKIKISENNSPLPRDRTYFMYNHFHNASDIQVIQPGLLSAERAYSVNRFIFGYEKTFAGGNASWDFRLPISYQMTDTPHLDYFTPSVPDAMSTTLGNLTLALKFLLTQSRTSAVSAGMKFDFPTASNVVVQAFNDDGTNFIAHQYTVQNTSFTISPWAAYVATPTDRFFHQGFAVLDIDTNGTGVQFQPFTDLGIFPVQHYQIQAQTLLRVDWACGYWLMMNRGGYADRLGAIFETHYTTALENADLAVIPEPVLGADVTVGNVNNRVDVMNMTLGAVIASQRGSTLQTGFVMPVSNGDNKAFDFEFTVQLNYRR